MKNKILTHAVEMYLNYGFKSVTMDDIANQLGISKKTLYLHYKNKKELVQNAVMSVSDKIVDGAEKIHSSGKNPIQNIFTFKSFLMKTLKNEKSPTYYELEKYYPVLFKKLKQKQFECIQDTLRINIEKGIAKGYYRKNIDIDFITRIYFNNIIGIKNLELFPTELYEQKYLMESFLEYHIRGIATEKGIEELQKTLNHNP